MRRGILYYSCSAGLKQKKKKSIIIALSFLNCRNLVVPMRWPLYFDGAAERSIPEIDPVELLSQPSASLMARTPQAKTPNRQPRLPKYTNKDNKKYRSTSLFGWDNEPIWVYFIIFILIILIICVIQF
jgi:hypothetical protein